MKSCAGLMRAMRSYYKTANTLFKCLISIGASEDVLSEPYVDLR
jgi:hypothetical protein